VERLVRVRFEFDAHHKIMGDALPDRPRCVRDHGHHWRVEVTKTGPESGLEGDVERVLGELADRSLNAMLPSLNPTPEDLSTLVMERLILRHPSIVEVTVDDGRLAGITRNTLR